MNIVKTKFDYNDFLIRVIRNNDNDGVHNVRLVYNNINVYDITFSVLKGKHFNFTLDDKGKCSDNVILKNILSEMLVYLGDISEFHELIECYLEYFGHVYYNCENSHGIAIKCYTKNQFHTITDYDVFDVLKEYDPYHRAECVVISIDETNVKSVSACFFNKDVIVKLYEVSRVFLEQFGGPSFGLPNFKGEIFEFIKDDMHNFTMYTFQRQYVVYKPTCLLKVYINDVLIRTTVMYNGGNAFKSFDANDVEIKEKNIDDLFITMKYLSSCRVLN